MSSSILFFFLLFSITFIYNSNYEIFHYYIKYIEFLSHMPNRFVLDSMLNLDIDLDLKHQYIKKYMKTILYYFYVRFFEIRQFIININHSFNYSLKFISFTFPICCDVVLYDLSISFSPCTWSIHLIFNFRYQLLTHFFWLFLPLEYIWKATLPNKYI